MWSESLASAALTYSLLCDTDPFVNGNPVTVPGFAGVGVTGIVIGTRRTNFTVLVAGVLREAINYDYTANRCTSPGACDYYWQASLTFLFHAPSS